MHGSSQHMEYKPPIQFQMTFTYSGYSYQLPTSVKNR